MQRDLHRIYLEAQVLAAQAGDRAAFERLVDGWQTRFLAHARRLTGDRDLARDAVQDAWVDIVRGLPRLRDPRAFPAWSFRIVTRKCAQAVGAIQKRRRTADSLRAHGASDAVQAPEAETRSDLAAVSAVIADLPAHQRAAVALHYLDGFSVTEISVVLGVPAGTVKTRLMHARRRIRAALEPHSKGDSNDTHQ